MTNQLAVMPTMELREAIDRRNQLVKFTQEIMVEGIDYGKVPGTEKNTLLLPGAEKLCSFFGLTPILESLSVIEDWTGQNTDREPFFNYRYKCKLYRGDMPIGEGVGSCNSREKKYRWRWVAESDLPPDIDPRNLLSRKSSISEFEFAINKAETGGRYGKPVEYWQEFEAAIKTGDAKQISKKTAKGSEYPAWEISSVVYRIPNDDIFSQVNTIDKMAQKRAIVSAVKVAVNASEFFTQDMEDFDTGIVIDTEAVVVEDDNSPKPQVDQSTGEVTEQPTTNGKPKSASGGVRTDEPMTAYWTEVNRLNIDHSHAQDLVKEHGPEAAILMLESVK